MSNRSAPITDLSAIDELAKAYASSYASPHHITFTAEGLRNFLAAAGVPSGWKLVPITPTPEMPQIGPLLDAWDGMDNDTKAALREDAPDLARALSAIARVMALTPQQLQDLNARIGWLLDKHLAPIFKLGTQLTFIARTPGNDEADVLVTTERDLNDVIALALRSLGRAAVGAGTDTVPRTSDVRATHAYSPSRHPNGYWCPDCVGPASAAGVQGTSKEQGKN